MEMDIKVIALLLSCLTFLSGTIFTVWTNRNGTFKSEIDILKARCDRLADDLKECREGHKETAREMKRLTQENMELMRKLVFFQNSKQPTP